MNFKIFFPLIIVLISCTDENTKSVAPPPSGGTQIPVESGDRVAVEPKAYEVLEANFFGDFHSDRVRFFTKENPDVRIKGVKARKAVLSYIDDDLVQKKYELTSDITANLIKQNRRFGIRGMNTRNNHFIRSLKSKVFSGNEIVSLINFYQLRWDLGDSEIIYQVRRDTVETFYTYIEQTKGYKEILKQVESAKSD